MSKRRVLGSADDDIAFFLHILSCFFNRFLLIMNMFCLADACKFCIFKVTIRCCIFLHIMTLFIVHDKICLQFTSKSAYLQYMEDTGRSKMRQKFWSFRGFRT